MSVMESIYERMGMKELRYMARQDSDTHDEKATRVYVDRIIDLELERRLVLRHNNPGYSPISSTATIGEPPGGGRAGDKILQGHNVSTPWHDRAMSAMSQLPPRQYAAALIRSAKSDYKAQGKWAKTYDHISSNVAEYMDILGFSGQVKAAVSYENGRAIRKAALSARTHMILLAKVGGI